MSDADNGFGSGLRAKLGHPAVIAPTAPPPPPAPTPEGTPAAIPDPSPLEQNATPEVSALQAELTRSFERERELRETLEHHVEAHERELAAGRELALQAVELEQTLTRLAEREAELEAREEGVQELQERVALERRDLNLRRTELLAEEARLVELGVRMEARTAEFEAAESDRAGVAAEVARELAVLAQRERDLRRDQGELDQQRAECVARETAIQARQAAIAARQRDLEQAQGAVESERLRLRERVELVAARELATEERLGDREAVVAEREARVCDREQALMFDEERLRALGGQAADARAARAALEPLVAEIERREQALRAREAALDTGMTQLRPVKPAGSQARDELLARGEAHLAKLRDELDRREQLATRAAGELASREAGLQAKEDDLRRHQAQCGAELELTAERLDLRAGELEEREQLLERRENELSVYVAELQRTVA